MRKFPSKKLWHSWKFFPLVGEGHFWAMNPSQAAAPPPSADLGPSGLFYLWAPVLLRLEETLRQELQQVLWGKWKGYEEATNCICRPHASLWASAPSSVKQGETVSKVPP